MATDLDLQYYIDNPDETPSDPVVLEKLLALMTEGVEPASKNEPEDKEADDGATASADEGGKQAGEELPDSKVAGDESKEGSPEPEKPQAEEDPEGVSTRDGKRIIPYDVLKSERERRQAAEEAASRLSAEVEAIKQQLAKGTSAGDDAATKLAEEAEGLLSQEDLAALREDFPVFGKVIDKLLGTVSTLSSQVESLSKREAGRESEILADAAASVQAVIDDIPVLAYLQANDQKLFAKAVEIDNALKGTARYPTLTDRLQKVAERMYEDFGPFDGVQAPTKGSSRPTPAAEGGSLTQSKEAVRKDVQKVIEKTKASPKSLSDLPAGDPGQDSPEAELEAMSPAEISSRLMRMKADERTAYLNNIRMH